MAHAGHAGHAGHAAGLSGDSGGHGGHDMATAFEWNARVRLLVSGWESQTAAEYAAVLVLLFVAGMLRELVAARRRGWLLSGAGDRTSVQVKKEAAMRYSCLYAYDMILMLFIMSFNIGVCGDCLRRRWTLHVLNPTPVSATSALTRMT